ncbi:hypothetical protein G7043_47220 [Lentzea sp. NEAU-D13]|uniref:Uncharacterized protein n=1 Tax=Lentzea alba TaxID=2714351 RepID=A0A7C9W2K1_9PSEU|nr:hypothetical protein [Lentzea alba]NGY66496.1 hypothetical protein [Lentzea alba]
MGSRHEFAHEWTVAERAVTHDEIGCSPLDCRHQVLAVVRHGQRLWTEDSTVAVLRGENRLLVVSPGRDEAGRITIAKAQ